MRHDPFFTTGYPCESCGLPVEGERFPAPWNTELLVGECCKIHCDDFMPDHPTCEAMLRVFLKATRVREIQEAWKQHSTSCPECIRFIREQSKQAVQAITSTHESGSVRSSREAA
jgi:hypothetical protein